MTNLSDKELSRTLQSVCIFNLICMFIVELVAPSTKYEQMSLKKPHFVCLVQLFLGVGIVLRRYILNDLEYKPKHLKLHKYFNNNTISRIHCRKQPSLGTNGAQTGVVSWISLALKLYCE